MTWTYFSVAINAHVTGLLAHLGQGSGSALPRGPRRDAWKQERRGFAKLARYYAREYLLFPALAGPFAWKVLLGDAASELLRDLYAGATIYCGHVGAHEFPERTHARNRAEWYPMQVESSRDFEVGGLLATLCGGLERQIEHHLFPRLPPNRLREVAPRVRAICEAHGVRYRSASWPSVLRDVFRRLSELSTSDTVEVAPPERRSL